MHSQKRILGYIYSLVPQAQDAEDLYNKMSIVLWRKVDSSRSLAAKAILWCGPAESPMWKSAIA
jgi:hypothetical protein